MDSGAYLELRSIEKSFAGVGGVRSISLAIGRGECMVLLGPSGCGKSTTINMIAGFLEPDGGEILVGGKLTNRVPPEKRNCGVVFQSYALFPHLTVFENVAYGLRNRGVAKAELTTAVHEALAIVHLRGYEERTPRQLSGGQQQRVALARAIVIKPDLLLLDEPLSNLDARLRAEMRVELSEIVRRSGVTSIFVTHDQEEAMAVADRIAVLRDGLVEQIGTATEIYHHPANAFVAGFLGSFNGFKGTVCHTDDPSRVVVRTAGGRDIVSVVPRSSRLPQGNAALVAVRPERLQFVRPGDDVDNRIEGIVERVMFLGMNLHYRVRAGAQEITLVVPNRGEEKYPAAGNAVVLGWHAIDGILLRDEEA